LVNAPLWLSDGSADTSIDNARLAQGVNAGGYEYHWGHPIVLFGVSKIIDDLVHLLVREVRHAMGVLYFLPRKIGDTFDVLVFVRMFENLNYHGGIMVGCVVAQVAFIGGII
jgi:hypothetical protein